MKRLENGVPVIGSNCGEVALDVLVANHFERMQDEWMVVTDHSRDADPKEAMRYWVNYFRDQIISESSDLQEYLAVDQNILTDQEKNRLAQALEQVDLEAQEMARQVSYYGDERIRAGFAEIEAQENDHIFKGVEVSMLPDGSFDTSMVEAGEFQYVNCSIHPKVDSAGFAEIITDAQKYTDLVVSGIQEPHVNVFCHIGYGCEPGFAEKLDWDRIAEAALKNGVAVEINLKELMDYIYKDMFRYEEDPKDKSKPVYKVDENDYRQVFEDRLPKLVPFLSSGTIMQKLQPYIKRGLKIAINTDEHKSSFTERDKVEEKYPKLNGASSMRFWRCLKIAEGYFNERFEQFGVKKEQIINTYTYEEMLDFLSKHNSHQS